ncbi:MAG: hypothetical protein WBG92_18100 [Thiohalocapsa sp.]
MTVWAKNPGFSKGGISPGDFHALIFWRQLVTAYQRQNRTLEAQVAELEAALEAERAVSPCQVPG